MTDTLLMKTGMQTLIDNLGCVDADYTEWRKDNLFNGMSIESISREAMDLHNSQQRG